MANMVPITAFFPLVLPFASGVPEPYAEQAIRLSAVRFCERTRCWRHLIKRRVDAFDVTLDPPAAPMSLNILPPYATIFEFEFATWNGNPLTPTQFSEVSIQSPDAHVPGTVSAWLTSPADAPADTIAIPETGTPEYITQTDPQNVTLLPVPSEAGELYMSLFLKPVSSDGWEGSGYDVAQDDDLNVLPDFLLVQHGEDLANGALARIMSVPDQSYTDMQMAAVYGARFEQALDGKFQQNLRGQQRAQPRAKSHFF